MSTDFQHNKINGETGETGRENNLTIYSTRPISKNKNFKAKPVFFYIIDSSFPKFKEPIKNKILNTNKTKNSYRDIRSLGSRQKD